MLSSLEAPLMVLTGRVWGCRLPTVLIHMSRDGEIITNTPSAVTVCAIHCELELPSGTPSLQTAILKHRQCVAFGLSLA